MPETCSCEDTFLFGVLSVLTLSYSVFTCSNALALHALEWVTFPLFDWTGVETALSLTLSPWLALPPDLRGLGNECLLWTGWGIVFFSCAGFRLKFISSSRTESPLSLRLYLIPPPECPAWVQGYVYDHRAAGPGSIDCHICRLTYRADCGRARWQCGRPMRVRVVWFPPFEAMGLKLKLLHL